MITHIQGRLVEKNPTDVVIDCNGIGYFINISLTTFSELPAADHVKLYTYLLVRDDAHTLYGFSTRAEREVFKLLISVSGVGAATARTMLSSLTAMEVVDAVVSEDAATLKSVKGIGVKTARRVILELKDKMLKVYGESAISVDTSNTNKNEALSALETLGFVRKRAEKVCNDIVKENPKATAEMIIKLALKKL